MPPDKVSEIIDFVDFLSQRQQQQSLTNSITQLSEAAFEKIWDRPEDDDYELFINWVQKKRWRSKWR